MSDWWKIGFFMSAIDISIWIWKLEYRFFSGKIDFRFYCCKSRLWFVQI